MGWMTTRIVLLMDGSRSSMSIMLGSNALVCSSMGCYDQMFASYHPSKACQGHGYLLLLFISESQALTKISGGRGLIISYDNEKFT